MRKTLRMKLVGGGALTGAMAMMLGGPALAQQAGIALPPIDVVSATTLPTPANEIASSVTVITAPEIEQQQRRTVTDLLANVPGVNVVQSGSPGSQTSVFIRGTNSNHVKVLLDGVDMGDSSTPQGAIDFGHLTTLDLERVEVLRGPQSGLYGSDAIGGVISLTTKKGAGPAKVTGLMEGGSFGTFNQAIGLSGSKDRFNYAFNISHFQFRDQPVTPNYAVPPGARPIGNAYNNWTYSTRLGMDVTDTLVLNFYGRYTDAKLLYTNDDPAAFPAATYRDQSTYKNTNYSGRGEAVWSLFDGAFVNVFGVNRTNFKRNNVDPDPFAPPTNFEGTTDRFDWRGNWFFAPGQALVMGVDRENYRAQGDTISAKSGNQGGFLELQSEYAKRLFLVANVRHDRHDQFGEHVSWRVAPAVILPVTETKLKASYGTGFKAPTLYQLYGAGPYGFVGNAALRPEQSTGYDAGFEQPIMADRVRFGATYFRNDIKDLINSVFVPVFTNVNVNQAVTYGAEVFAEAVLTKTLKMRVDYTRTTAKDATTGLELLRRPRHKYSWTTTWDATDKLSLSSTVLYLGRWRDIDRVTFALEDGGGVATVNLAANYAVNKNLTAFVRADNLFDRRYENPVGWMQPGLAVYGGVRMMTN